MEITEDFVMGKAPPIYQYHEVMTRDASSESLKQGLKTIEEEVRMSEYDLAVVDDMEL